MRAPLSGRSGVGSAGPGSGGAEAHRAAKTGQATHAADADLLAGRAFHPGASGNELQGPLAGVLLAPDRFGRAAGLRPGRQRPGGQGGQGEGQGSSPEPLAASGAGTALDCGALAAWGIQGGAGGHGSRGTGNVEVCAQVVSMSFSGHRARHRFGQHWLINAAVLDRIVAAAALQPHDRVLEVGPGRGALTERLLASNLAALEAIELDRDLVAGLKQRFGPDPRFQLTAGDALRAPIERQGPRACNKVVANIPYNITGPLLQRLLGSLEAPLTPPFELLVLLVQREVGERIRAQPGTSAYGALSVRMQLLGHCQLVCPVPPSCFKPPPKVDSEVLLIEPFAAGSRLAAAGAEVLDPLLRRCFASRRKMLRNTLAGLLPPEQLRCVAGAVGVDLAARPQDLSPSRWLALAAGLNPAIPAAAFALPADG